MGRRPALFVVAFQEELLEKLNGPIHQVLEEERVELVEVNLFRQGRRWILRLLVDEPGGVSLEHCARVNQRLGNLLEESNLIQESYFLEVNSPGLDRPLKTPRDFERATGRLVRVELTEPIGERGGWVGFLRACDGETISLETEAKEWIRIPLSKISWAREEIRF